MANSHQQSETHGYKHLSVLVRGESRSERAAYGTHRIEAAQRSRKHSGAPPAPGRFSLPPGIHPTPDHDLGNQGGKTMPALTYTNLYVAGNSAWNAGDKQNIDAALSAIMTEPKLVTIVQQYFPDAISSRFTGSMDLTIPAPQTVSRGDVDRLFQQALDARLITGNLDTTVFNFLLPPGTVLSDDATPTGGAVAAVRTAEAEDQVSSLEGLGGYHGSVHLSGQRYYFAVGVYSQVLGSGQQNGIVAFDLPWKNVVATLYHELQEARTDADVEDVNNQVPGATLGWISAKGEEIGDFPVFEDPRLHDVFVEIGLTAGGTAPIQLIYSNRAHGPELPA